MTKFSETTEGQEFIASGDSRETSREIMDAIAFFARDTAEAEALWNGDFAGICHPTDIWENVTKNGLRDPKEFCWGAAGSAWWSHIDPSAV